MVDKKLIAKAESIYNDIEQALMEAVEKRHYSSAKQLAKVLSRLQLHYGDGVSMSQSEDNVLIEAMTKMADYIQDPMKYQQWESVAYCADMLAIIEGVLQEG